MSRPSKYFGIEELTPPGYNNWSHLDQNLVDLVDKLRELNGHVVRCNFDGLNHRGYREPSSTVGAPNSAHRYGEAADLFFYDANGERINKSGDVGSADAMRAKINQWNAQGLLPQLSWMEPGVTWIHVQVSGSTSQTDVNPDLTVNSTQTNSGNMDLYIKPTAQVASANATYGVAVGNEITLSNYNSDSASVAFFKNLFTKAGLDQNEISALIPAIGISQGKINEYIASNTLQLTNEKCNNLLYSFVDANAGRLKSDFGLVLSQHPKEINTALVSFIFDMSFDTEKSIKTLSNQITSYLITKKYNEIADLIEAQGDGKIDSIKNKRINEARLIRLRKSDVPNYTVDDSKIDPDAFFNGKSDGLNAAVSDARGNINNLQNKKQSESSANSAPGARDETYQEITKEISDSFADLLEKQQIITDNHHNELDSEYLIRINLKNLYTNMTRNHNQTYMQVEKSLEQASSNDAHYRLSYAYSIFPMGARLFYNIKNNAVNRATYRIKKLTLQKEQIESELIELGVVNLLTPLIGLPLVALINVDKIAKLVVEYLEVTAKLANEKGNLGNLIKDLNHYNKKIVNI